jgi:hypothetical protein
VQMGEQMNEAHFGSQPLNLGDGGAAVHINVAEHPARMELDTRSPEGQAPALRGLPSHPLAQRDPVARLHTRGHRSLRSGGDMKNLNTRAWFALAVLAVL